MAELNWGILDTNAPAKVANAFYQGQQEVMQNNLAKAQLQQAQGANALQQYQLTSAQRNDQVQNRMLADLQASNGDPEQIKNALIRAGKPQDAFKLQTDQANLKKTQTQTAVEALKARKQLSAAVFANPTQDAALNSISQFEQLTGQDLSQEKQNVINMQGNPDAIKQWAAGHAIEADKLLPHFEKVDNNGQIITGAVNPINAQFTPTGQINKVVSPDAQLHNSVLMRGQNMTDARQREMNGIMADGQSNEEVNRMAQGIANGQLAPLSGYSLATPRGRMIMSKVLELNPNYNSQNYATSQKADKDFATGKQGQAVKSFNVALDHLDTLDQLAGALNNKDTQLFNKVGNYYTTQSGQPAPTNFEAAKKIVADEVIKAIVGSGGGVTDREEAAKTISSASSPAQLQGVIQTYKSLMKGQLNGLSDQYKATTGRNDFEDRYLSKNAKATVHGSQNHSSAGKPSLDEIFK